MNRFKVWLADPGWGTKSWKLSKTASMPEWNHRSNVNPQSMVNVSAIISNQIDRCEKRTSNFIPLLIIITTFDQGVWSR
jgi:hypothetical protein